MVNLPRTGPVGALLSAFAVACASTVPNPVSARAQSGHSFGYYGGDTWGPDVFAWFHRWMGD